MSVLRINGMITSVFLIVLWSCNKGGSVVIVPKEPPVDTIPVPPPPPPPPTVPFVDHWVKVADSLTNGQFKKYIGALEYQGKLLFVAMHQVSSGARFGVYQYDTTSRIISTLGVVSSAFGEYSPSIFLVQDNLYLHSLINSTANVLRAFNLTSYTWTQKTPITFYTTVPVLKMTSFSIGNFGYTYYNYGGSIASHNIYRYDPSTDKWSIAASGLLSSVSLGAVAVTTGAKSYLMGSTSKLYEFNADSSKMISLAPFPAYCFYPYSFILVDQMHVGGGGDFSVGMTPPGDTITSSTITNRHWIYSLSKNTWTEHDRFTGSKRTEAIGFTYNGVGYVLGGRVIDSVTKKAVYIFDLWKYKP